MRLLSAICRFIPIIALFLFSKQLLAADPIKTITAADAYLSLAQKAKLESVTVMDKFDIAKINAPPSAENTVLFYNVTFEKELLLDVEAIYLDISFRECFFKAVKIVNVKWFGSLQFLKCKFSGPVDLIQNNFQSDFICHGSTFCNRTRFEGSHFNANAEFIDCSFTGLRTSFSNALFLKPTIFNFSKFRKILNMNYAIFRDGVNFLKCEIGEARFQNSMFHGDAEFRYCDIKTGLFSSPLGITVFFGAADFRKCSIEKAVFDYAEFRGPTYFLLAEFGKGGVSFANTNFSGKITNLDAVKSKGIMKLDCVYMQNLTFHLEGHRASDFRCLPSLESIGHFVQPA